MLLNNRSIIADNDSNIFILASILISLFYFLLIVPGQWSNIPVWSDAYQYLGDYQSKFKLEGRWLNALFFQYLHGLPPSLALYLEYLTNILILYALLRKILTQKDLLKFAILALILLSTRPVFELSPWPGGRIPTNLATIAAILIIQSQLRPLQKTILASTFGCAILGGYQFNYFILILVPLLHYKNISTRVFIITLSIWISVFLAGGLLSQLIKFIVFGPSEAGVQSYRVLNSDQSNRLIIFITNIPKITKNLIGQFFAPYTTHPYLASVAFFSIFALTFSKFVIEPISNLEKTFCLAWILAPPLAIIFVLALLNHIYLPRISFSIYVSLIIVIFYSYTDHRLLNPIWYIAILLILIVQTNYVSKENNKISDSVWEDIHKLRAEIGVESQWSHLILSDPLGKFKTNQFSSFRYANFIQDQVDVRLISYCHKSESKHCKKISDLLKSNQEKDVCNKTQKFDHLTIIIHLSTESPACKIQR